MMHLDTAWRSRQSLKEFLFGIISWVTHLDFDFAVYSLMYSIHSYQASCLLLTHQKIERNTRELWYARFPSSSSVWSFSNFLVTHCAAKSGIRTQRETTRYANTQAHNEGSTHHRFSHFQNSTPKNKSKKQSNLRPRRRQRAKQRIILREMPYRLTSNQHYC
jgi:hypothetical protein